MTSPVPIECPGQDRLAQVQVLQECVEVGGEGVVVVADGGLAGPAEPAPVVGDDPVARASSRAGTCLSQARPLSG